MKTWKRAKVKQPCGSCGINRAWIPEGTPMLEIDINGTLRVRCVDCAARLFGEQPPVDLPEAVAVQAPPAPIAVAHDHGFVRPRAITVPEVEDLKKRAAGDD